MTLSVSKTLSPLASLSRFNQQIMECNEMNSLAKMTDEEIEKNFPETAKMKAVGKESQVIGEFLDWLQAEKQYMFGTSIENLLAEYYHIDQYKMHKEQETILKMLREGL